MGEMSKSCERKLANISPLPQLSGTSSSRPTLLLPPLAPFTLQNSVNVFCYLKCTKLLNLQYRFHPSIFKLLIPDRTVGGTGAYPRPHRAGVHTSRNTYTHTESCSIGKWDNSWPNCMFSDHGRTTIHGMEGAGELHTTGLEVWGTSCTHWAAVPVHHRSICSQKECWISLKCRTEAQNNLIWNIYRIVTFSHLHGWTETYQWQREQTSQEAGGIANSPPLQNHHIAWLWTFCSEGEVLLWNLCRYVIPDSAVYNGVKKKFLLHFSRSYTRILEVELRVRTD